MSDITPAPGAVPAPPAPPAPAPAASEPGKGLGIAGLVLAFFIPLVGLILSIIARSQSKKAGVPNTPATVGLILSIVFLVIGIIVAIIVGVSLASAAAYLTQVCTELGDGVHEVGGVTYTCNA